MRVTIEGRIGEGKTILGLLLKRFLVQQGYRVKWTETAVPPSALRSIETHTYAGLNAVVLQPRDVDITVVNDEGLTEFGAYQRLARRTQAVGQTNRDKLLNAVLGLTEESGEVAGFVKKHMFHGHTLPKEKVRKELGDILWYIGQACDAMGWKMEDIAQENIDKLKARYPEGFSHERSIHRDAPEFVAAREEDLASSPTGGLRPTR